MKEDLCHVRCKLIYMQSRYDQALKSITDRLDAAFITVVQILKKFQFLRGFSFRHYLDQKQNL